MKRKSWGFTGPRFDHNDGEPRRKPPDDGSITLRLTLIGSPKQSSLQRLDKLEYFRRMIFRRYLVVNLRDLAVLIDHERHTLSEFALRALNAERLDQLQ